VLNRPSVSDAEYDRLFERLRRLETEYPQLALSYSPTRRVGGFVQEGFDEVTHAVPMLSLENALSKKDVSYFFQTVRDKLGADFEITVEYKFDGLAVSLIYEDSVFTIGATRGDGFKGENVTENLKTVRSIPLKLFSHIVGRFEVRGEVVMPIEDFKRLNEQRLADGLEPFRSPRNAAAGAVRVLNTRTTAERNLKFFAYLALCEKIGFKSHSDVIRFLQDLGFLVSPLFRVVNSEEEVFAIYEEVLGIRSELEFEVDGLVLKVNNLDYQDLLGFRSRSPRWALAFKFPPNEAYTEVLDIKFQVGRTGIITPVCYFRPVMISGAVVSKATLHNCEELRRKDIMQGDTIVVRRQGDVIPYVVGVVWEKRRGQESRVKIPELCPICSGELVQRGGLGLFCVNPYCPAKLEAYLKYIFSKDCLNVEGMGVKTIQKLIEKGIVNSFSDALKLKAQDFMSLAGFKDKSSKKLEDQLRRSVLGVELWRFINSLGISHVGRETARILSKSFRSLTKFENATLEDLLRIPGIGSQTAEAIIHFKSSSAWNEWKKLINDGIVRLKEVEIATNQTLSGKSFVFTGTLNRFSRDEARKIVEKLGGKVLSSVSKKTDFVVVGENPGSKFNEAKALGLKILGEKEFLNLLEQTDLNKT
ncbi:MAG: NAD-dependent DNA ligase LigA, partial [Deltaproteobacteria bacterium]|nr:NAD-dependent DNA ligase LigA [Deltaproteobacteria bacterium]